MKSLSLTWGLLLAISVSFDVAISAPIQNSFYVSPRGSDANSGTEELPFRTLDKAKNAVRLVNGTMTGDIEVFLRGGTYTLSHPISFGPQDGGKDGFYVRYKNYPNETPLITGGIPITNWTLHDPANNIWKSTGVTARFRQLYVNGNKSVRARMPNLGAGGSHNFYRLTKVDTTGRALDISAGYFSNWNNLTKVEMHLMIAWADATLRLASASTSGGVTKLKIQDPEGTMLFNRPYPMLGVTFGDPTRQQCFFLENAYEFIDQPGEWYLDESANTLYYMPQQGEDMSTAAVVVPILENLFSITGTNTSQMVGYMEFHGLTFAHSSFMRPSSSGLLNLQAGQFNTAAPGGNNYMLWRPAAGVTVTNAHNLRFERNVFTQMAASGLDFISGTHDNMILGNVFTELGGTGITLGKFAQDTLTEVHIPYNPSDRNEISTRDTVKNNLVTKVTTEIQGAIGIAAGYPRELLIEHNEVSYTNYSGISVGFGWTRSSNAMTSNKINWNKIHHVSQLLADAGSIYILSNQGTGSQIHYNYMHDIHGSQWADYWINGMYLDEGASGYDVSHNVIVNAPSGIACNQCGTYTASDNDGRSASTIANAGIEPAYIDIRSKVISTIPDFTIYPETVPQAPYLGIRAPLPGRIEAENYDIGGQGVSFFDTDYQNQGGVYRSDGVDIVGDSLLGYQVGYTIEGEWMEYSVQIEEAGVYHWTASVSTGLDGASFHIMLDSTLNLTDPIPVPNGASWDTYTTLSGTTPVLPSGEHILRIVITGSYLNLDYIEFAKEQATLFAPSYLKPQPNRPKPTKLYDLLGKLLGRRAP